MCAVVHLSVSAIESNGMEMMIDGDCGNDEDNEVDEDDEVD